MQVQKITENVFIANFLDMKRSEINDAPQTITVTCIALPNQLIFVDCGVYTKKVIEFRKQMEEHFQRKTSHLLLTHIHWDHILSMKAFKDVDVVVAKKGIPGLKRSYSGYLNLRERKDRANIYQKEDPEVAEDIENAELFIPNTTVKDELEIGEEDQKIIFKVIGNHTAESAIVLIPSEKIMCTGDNLVVTYPQLIRSSFKTIDMYKSWEDMDIELFIPGHGNPVKKEYVISVRKYYESLVDFLKVKIKEKTSIRKILKDKNLPRYFAIGSDDWSFACRPEDNWLESGITSWHRFLKKNPDLNN